MIRLDDDDFQRLVARMQEEWESLKKEIVKVRQGESKTALYELSEDYFSLADPGGQRGGGMFGAAG